MPRYKTAEARRAWLWPETLEAIRRYLAIRRDPVNRADARRVFLSVRGCPWIRADGKPRIIPHFRERLLAKAPFYRPGHALYSLRRTFRTVADETQDGPELTS